MDGDRRATARKVRPGISQPDLQAIWDETLAEAVSRPGETAVLLFAPGVYPLPRPGTFVYKEVATPLHVSKPGAELRFRHLADTGETYITSDPAEVR